MVLKIQKKKETVTHFLENRKFCDCIKLQQDEDNNGRENEEWGEDNYPLSSNLLLGIQALLLA